MNTANQMRHTGTYIHKNFFKAATGMIVHPIFSLLFPDQTALKNGEAQLAVPLTSPQYSPQIKGYSHVLTA